MPQSVQVFIATMVTLICETVKYCVRYKALTGAALHSTFRLHDAATIHSYANQT